VEDSVSSVDEQRNGRMQQIYTPKLRTHSECKNRVCLPRPLSKLTNIPTDKEAGQAFERAAAIQTKNLNEPDDAANTLTEAFKVYRKSDPLDAARCLDVAINHYTMKGNFRRAATHKQNLAEVYETELGDPKKAIESYELASSWFENDNAEAYALLLLSRNSLNK
jgi:tetratricopeptide (TPR) repeat protein